jgi:serine/threonine protein kinase
LKKLGKYELLGELGHGAMGVVYRARDPVINRLVALKTITIGVADDASLLQRFYREAQSAGGLQHPNIVTIYDMGEAGNLPYIAMELVEGENLEQVIARRPSLPITLKLVYAMQACRAFDYAHKRGIVHRDIKPGNVMLGKDGTVKVVDFGIARVLEASRTQTGMLIGTFAYMSPEQYHGEHADERSDIWSFGVLLYELLCYERPFKGSTPASLMHGICQETPGPLKKFMADCPEELDVIITRVLQKVPADRYQSMEDLLLDLDPVCKKLQVQQVAELIEQSRKLLDQGEFASCRDVLRQALQLEAGNHQARSLMEKANAELKRLQNRPNVEQFIAKGRALLQEGKFEEARAAAKSALQLDSTFQPAQELRAAVDCEIDQARMRAETLAAARQRLAEGLPEEAEGLLAKVLLLKPHDEEVLAIQKQVAAEKAERQRIARLMERLRHARELWTRQTYNECIQLLMELEKEYPGEEEILRLL